MSAFSSGTLMMLRLTVTSPEKTVAMKSALSTVLYFSRCWAPRGRRARTGSPRRPRAASPCARRRGAQLAHEAALEDDEARARLRGLGHCDSSRRRAATPRRTAGRARPRRRAARPRARPRAPSARHKPSTAASYFGAPAALAAVVVGGAIVRGVLRRPARRGRALLLAAEDLEHPVGGVRAGRQREALRVEVRGRATPPRPRTRPRRARAAAAGRS